MNDSKREHQLLLLEMLKDFDAVCKKHGIRYSLFAGTALGAVRHQGFIPWDDDLDILMLRDDYERFFAVAPSEFDPDTYYVQQEFSSHWCLFFSKLRRNHTAAIEKYHPRDPLVHQGVYIDIFPCDNLSDSKFVRKLQFLASKVVIAKCLTRRGYETESKLKKIFMFFCHCLPLKPLWRFSINRKQKNTAMLHSFFGCGTKYSKSVYPREWFTELTELPFEDGVFPISAHYDELLTCLYDDYMRIPEPEERKVKEHVAILDLHNSYEQYVETQRNMKIDVYTRSIR